MKQTLLIGLGGTGSRIVNKVAKILQEKSIPMNDGKVACAIIDTDKSDMKRIKESGTQIPIIPTSKPQTIDQYLATYAGKNDTTIWFPYGRSLGAESMLDGASEMRVKSRLGFMDIVEDGSIRELETSISKIFQDREDDKIRVMVVSSLSGGTGSGCFIQVALWLRKFFEDERHCQVMIRGIFLLPDVFVRTIDSIRRNPRKKLYHYANAYAAIRELNALNRIIQKNYVPERRMTIDGLFDSDHPRAKPIYDFAFFIDDVDDHAVAFNSIGAYESVAAQLIFMQLYAPMVNELSSVEDNLYRVFEKSSEPLFGSCGTAKAVYPVKDIVDYCALRAARDSLQEGWNSIDSDIDAMIDEERQQEEEGLYIEKKISRSEMFIKLFDERAEKSGANIGKGDRLFVSIRKDIDNEKREKNNEEIEVKSSPKVEDFLIALRDKIQNFTSEHTSDEDLTIDLPKIDKKLGKKKIEDSKILDKLKGVRGDEVKLLQKMTEKFENNVHRYSEELLREVFSVDMGEINAENAESVYGLFLKTDLNGKKHYVHPLAAKYILYKLLEALSGEEETIILDKKVYLGEKGDGILDKWPVSFNLEETKKQETISNFFDTTANQTYVRASIFATKFAQLYDSDIRRLREYCENCLKRELLHSMIERVQILVSIIEGFFKQISNLSTQIADDIQHNITKNESKEYKILYVNASRKNKEDKYASLGFDATNASNFGSLNESVVRSIYGKFCYKMRSYDEDNLEFGEKNIIKTFYQQMLQAYREYIMKEYADEINLNVCQAIVEEDDAAYEKAHTLSDDPFSADNDPASKESRHNEAIKDYLHRLANMAAPFLHATPEATLEEAANMQSEVYMETSNGKRVFMPMQTRMTFWGFHPDLIKMFPALDESIGANNATAADVAYSENEIYCYRSIYGVKAAAIDKFNEMKNGEYFKCYDAVIRDMIRTGSYIDTPHLDKTWHEFIPYVSGEKQKEVETRFYTAFWLALAYGTVAIKDDGMNKYFTIRRKAVDGYGREQYLDEVITLDGEKVTYTEIDKLLRALKNDAVFEITDMPKLFDKFKKGLDGINTYEKTDLIVGMKKNPNLNPVTVLARYTKIANYSINVSMQLRGALEYLFMELVQHMKDRSEEKAEKVMYKICHDLYYSKKCKPVIPDDSAFGSWKDAFESYKFPKSDDTAETTKDADSDATEKKSAPSDQ